MLLVAISSFKFLLENACTQYLIAKYKRSHYAAIAEGKLSHNPKSFKPELYIFHTQVFSEAEKLYSITGALSHCRLFHICHSESCLSLCLHRWELVDAKKASQMHVAPRIVVHCCPLLTICPRCCPRHTPDTPQMSPSGHQVVTKW